MRGVQLIQLAPFTRRHCTERLRGVRARRDEAVVARRLESLREASRAYVMNGAKRPPIMELIIDAVRARASVGEIADALRDEWGTYRPT